MNRLDEFSKYETVDEILEVIKNKTIDKILEDQDFMSLYPNIHFGEMRLDYLIDNKHDMFLDLYFEDKLIDHIKEIQIDTVSFLRQEKPKIMQSWCIKNETDTEYPTMVSALKEIAIKEIVER